MIEEINIDSLRDRHKAREPWQDELASMLRTPSELMKTLDLRENDLPSVTSEFKHFPLRVTQSYVRRMQKGNPSDPLLLQVLPLNAEEAVLNDFSFDPLGESGAAKTPGILHKYYGRVLMIVTGACAIHCRYCFRRNFPYEEHRANTDQWQNALEYIAQTTTLSEVILSGGDPLTLPNRLLDQLIGKIETIPHITTLRIHSRLPIVLPSRITSNLTKRLANSRLQVVVVVHANHPNEIDKDVGAGLSLLKESTTALLNQTVLLRKINDDRDTLGQLSKKLFKYGVLPYYLHMLDRVHGTAHFEVCEIKAKQLIQDMQADLPGYLTPKLVREYAGAPSKTWASLS